MAQPVLQSAVRRLAGCFKDGAIGREQPSVIAAAYSLGVDQPKFQRCAAMGTMQLQQTHGAAQVAEHHQFFAENFHSLRQITQFVGEADRLPKAAQVFAARRAGSNMGELAVLAGDVAMEVAAKSRLQEGGSGGHCGPPFNYWIDFSLLNSSRRPGRWSDGSAGTRGRVAGTDCSWRAGPGTPDSSTPPDPRPAERATSHSVALHYTLTPARPSTISCRLRRTRGHQRSPLLSFPTPTCRP